MSNQRESVMEKCEAKECEAKENRQSKNVKPKNMKLKRKGKGKMWSQREKVK